MIERFHLNFFTYEFEYFVEQNKRLMRVGQIPNIISKFKEYTELRKKTCSWIDNLKGPVFVPIDITYKCNLNCPYCYVSASHRKSTQLPKDKVFKILDELSEMDVLGICLCGGESTLHKNILDIINYASSKGIFTNMVTNGTLINEKFASKLSESGIKIVQVSVDGSKPEIMDALRGKGAFERAINAIRVLRAYDIPVSISFCSTRLNIMDFPNVVELGYKLGVYNVRTMYFVPENIQSCELTSTEEQYKELVSWILENIGKYPLIIEFGDPTEHIVLGQFIGHLSFIINAEGYILPSPYLSLAYGTIDDGIANLWNELQEIWVRNPVLKALSENIKTEKDFIKLYKLSINRGEEERLINLREMSWNELHKLATKVVKVLAQ